MGNSVSTYTSNGDVVIYPNSKITYTATQRISLKPGFRVKSGANFHAVIASCPNNIRVLENSIIVITDTNFLNQRKFIATDELLQSQKEWTNAIMKIFPNPTSTNITINSSEKIQLLRIYDITGRTLTQYSTNSTSSTIDVSQLNLGTYFVEIVSEKGKSIEKFVKG